MGATAAESQVAITNDRTLGLEQIPLELRTEIYDKSVDEINELDIPADFKGSALSYLTRQLPPGLALNHQIHSEAAMAYFRRSMLSLEKIVAPCPQMLLANASPTLLFNNLHHLEFTSEQGHSTPRPGFANPTTAYDVTSRCPELRILKMRVACLKPDQTVKEVDAALKLTEILDHCKKLHTIELTCPSAQRWIQYKENAYTTPFDEFAAWFSGECSKRGRDIDFLVEIGPQDLRSRRHPELMWQTRGHVKTAWYMDFFG